MATELSEHQQKVAAAAVLRARSDVRKGIEQIEKEMEMMDPLQPPYWRAKHALDQLKRAEEASDAAGRAPA